MEKNEEYCIAGTMIDNRNEQRKRIRETATKEKIKYLYLYKSLAGKQENSETTPIHQLRYCTTGKTMNYSTLEMEENILHKYLYLFVEVTIHYCFQLVSRTKLL